MQTMMINPEDIVQMALKAHHEAYGEKGGSLLQFELELRRALMQRESTTTNVPHTYTYTIPAGSVTGTWSTTTNKQVLHG